MATVDEPSWTKSDNLRQVWTEDECLRHDPTAEDVNDAWLRLYGEEMPPFTAAAARWDGGDAVLYLFTGDFPGGRVYMNACDGRVLYELTCTHRRNSAATDQTFMCNCFSTMISEAVSSG